MCSWSFVCDIPRALGAWANAPEKCIVMEAFIECSSCFIQVVTTLVRASVARTIPGFKAEPNEVTALTMTPNLAFNIYFMCMSVACVFVHHVWPWCQKGPEDGTRSPRPGVMDGYKTPCACWEPNPDPLEKQQVFLTLSVSPARLPAISSLQLPHHVTASTLSPSQALSIVPANSMFIPGRNGCGWEDCVPCSSQGLKQYMWLYTSWLRTYR